MLKVKQISSDNHTLFKSWHSSASHCEWPGIVERSCDFDSPLKAVLLEQNTFNSSIPVEIGNLSNLEELRLSDNFDLAPSMIPLEFSGLKKLRIMFMSQASLIGEIPASIFSNLSVLENVDLSWNTLTGPIPEGFFRLRNLKILLLAGNHLDGELPTPIETFDLVAIDLCRNRL